MGEIADELKAPLLDLLLAVADDKFVLGHRNADWTGLAPILEEDIAFSSLAQDELAHALSLYEMAADLLGTTADALAYGRKSAEYRCATIVEQPDAFNWATAIGRQFFCDHFDILRLKRLAESSWPPLAALGKRLAAEEAIHVDHVDSWVRRLGNGGDESHRRIQTALDSLAPLAGMLFEPTEGQEALESVGVYPPGPADMFERWRGDLLAVAGDAGLNLNLERPPAEAVGGRGGRHSEAFEALLDELCQVYRLEPQAQW
ncbi:MAG: 1,2-phenylacetyl-CoA epoxidase subunit PaaC [Planctomycetota bacterium]|jgi:ring-1,2-phenylacetyl-CoA epoxidase subunit PaaC